MNNQAIMGKIDSYLKQNQMKDCMINQIYLVESLLLYLLSLLITIISFIFKLETKTDCAPSTFSHTYYPLLSDRIPQMLLRKSICGYKLSKLYLNGAICSFG